MMGSRRFGGISGPYRRSQEYRFRKQKQTALPEESELSLPPWRNCHKFPEHHSHLARVVRSKKERRHRPRWYPLQEANQSSAPDTKHLRVLTSSPQRFQRQRTLLGQQAPPSP